VTILIDSDILIEVTRGRDAGIVSRWEDLSASDEVILCSPVTVAELWHGARKEEHGSLANLFSSLVCVPIDAKIGQVAGDFLRQFRKSHGLELGDALIAAGTVANNAVLWTRNRKHYPMAELAFY
jgi:predicted nucleic acid-binding protein